MIIIREVVSSGPHCECVRDIVSEKIIFNIGCVLVVVELEAGLSVIYKGKSWNS